MYKDLKDKIFDDILEYALEQECEKSGESMPSESELSESISISPEFEEKMYTLFANEKRKSRRKNTFNIAKKIAACIIIAFLLNIILLIGVQAYRIQFFNMFIDVKDEFTTFFFRDESDKGTAGSNQIPADWQGEYFPAYIPEGFSISKVSDAGNIKRIIFSSKDTQQTINFSYCPVKTSTFSIDTEDANTYKIDISGNEGYISEKDIDGGKRTSIIFRNNSIVFSLITPFDKEKSIKIATSIEKIK